MVRRTLVKEGNFQADLAALVGSVENTFFLTVHYFSSVAQQARQAVMSRRLSVNVCLVTGVLYCIVQAFVLENKKFVKLPEEEKGVFHSGDSYVFLCRSDNPQ
jgi:hypothetical protein